MQRAGAAFRWTGSWLTAFVTPDPAGRVRGDRGPARRDLRRQLDRFRQAGRDAYVLDPDATPTSTCEITVCVAPIAYPGEVEGARAGGARSAARGVRAQPGFFSPDNFTFGTPLERSELEAAIQASSRRAGGGRHPDPPARLVRLARRSPSSTFDGGATTRCIRVQNDPFLPERGSLQLTYGGGA